VVQTICKINFRNGTQSNKEEKVSIRRQAVLTIDNPLTEENRVDTHAACLKQYPSLPKLTIGLSDMYPIKTNVTEINKR